MNVEKITIENFKKIKHLTIDFKKGFNLIIGDNSSGKTSILEAISVGLGGFLAGINDIKTINFNKDEIRRVNTLTGDGSYNTKYETPITVNCNVIVDNELFKYSRKKNSFKSSRTTVEPRNICKKAAEIANSDVFELPIISYQSAVRMWSQKKDKWNNPFNTNYSRVVGYTDCLDESSNTKMLTNWCKKMEQVSWQSDKKIMEYENAKLTIAKFISYMTDASDADIFYDKRSDELVCKTNGEILPLRLFSAGYRSMIGMVFDIACRMSILNPNMLDNAYKTHGIVLIDELDLHLHPKWQWKIIEALEKTFPNVQFIATTHSPIILSSYKGDSIIYVSKDTEIEYKASAYGYQINHILDLLQETDSRVPEISKIFADFYSAIANNNLNIAETILNDLENKLSDRDPDITEAKTTLELEKL